MKKCCVFFFLKATHQTFWQTLIECYVFLNLLSCLVINWFHIYNVFLSNYRTHFYSFLLLSFLISHRPSERWRFVLPSVSFLSSCPCHYCLLEGCMGWQPRTLFYIIHVGYSWSTLTSLSLWLDLNYALSQLQILFRTQIAILAEFSFDYLSKKFSFYIELTEFWRICSPICVCNIKQPVVKHYFSSFDSLCLIRL